VFFSLFVGAAMLGIGLAYRLLSARKPSLTRTATSSRVVDGEFRVVGKTALPSA